MTRAAAILLTLWISLLAGISSATVHHGQEGVDPAAYPLAAYGYDANGNLAGVSYANQVTHAYAYNALNRLTGLAVDRQPGGSGAIATPLQGYGYTLNLAGQRTGIAELGGRTIAHTYDALHRLRSETIGHALGDAAPTPLGSISYDYDERGNRWNRTTLAQNTVGGVNLETLLPEQYHFYNERDQLDGDTYDANGNTTSSAQGGTGGSPVSASDTYSFDNRLIRRVRGDGLIVDILYNPDGDRVAKWTEQGGLMRSIHRYLVDRLNPTGYAQVLEEKDGTGQLVARHLYGHDLIASDILNLQSSIINRQWYCYDGLGSVRGLTDDTGVVQETYDYDAYGTLIGFAKRNGAGDLEIQNPNNLELITNNRYLFTGEQWDADLGMYFLRARYLNPGTGRFHTEDTYEGRNGEPLTLHKYLYAHANPVMGADPSGNFYLSTLAYGNRVHDEVGRDFLDNRDKIGHVAFYDKSIKAILSTINGSPARGTVGGRLRPDLVDISSNEVWEIKPILSVALAFPQVMQYIVLLSFQSKPQRLFTPGVSYIPPVVVPINPTTAAVVFNAGPGVILYFVNNNTENSITLALAGAGIAVESLKIITAATTSRRSAVVGL